MADLFDNSTDRAFEPFFTEEMAIEMKNGKRQTVRCFVASDITGDPISDELMDTQRKGIAISFKKSDWLYIANITRGDKIYRAFNNKTYSVEEVQDDFAMGFIIKAREMK